MYITFTCLSQGYGLSIGNPARAFGQENERREPGEESFYAEFAVTKNDGFYVHERYECDDGYKRFYSTKAILEEINEIANLSRENKF